MYYGGCRKMTKYFKISEDRLKELIECEHKSLYYSVKEEWGSNCRLSEDIPDEKLQEELSYFEEL